MLYLGRTAHEVPAGESLFDYAVNHVQDADEEESDGESNHSDDGEHGPDAPDAIAPPSGQDLWVMKVEDVVSIVHADGLLRTYVVGTTFVTRSYVEQAFPANVVNRLAECVAPTLCGIVIDAAS